MTDDHHTIPPPSGSDPPSIPAAEERNSLITVNFKEGSVVSKSHFDAEGGIPKFLRDMAKYAKKNNVKSVIVMTINDDEHVDWVHAAESEYHLALAALCLDDLKDDLKDSIFGDDGSAE
jgi:hypothetical protein